MISFVIRVTDTSLVTNVYIWADIWINISYNLSLSSLEVKNINDRLPERIFSNHSKTSS